MTCATNGGASLRARELQETVEVIEGMHEQYFDSSARSGWSTVGTACRSHSGPKGHAKILIDTRRLHDSLTSSDHSDAVRDFAERSFCCSAHDANLRDSSAGHRTDSASHAHRDFSGRCR